MVSKETRLIESVKADNKATIDKIGEREQFREREKARKGVKYKFPNPWKI